MLSRLSKWFCRALWTLLGLFVLAVLFLPVDAPAQSAGQGESAAKATTIRSADFLKVPDGVPAGDYAVAGSAPTVDVAFFEGLDNSKKGTLWSSWGDGCLAGNGKYYTSVGDHLGTDANSYVYEYDPMTRVLRRVVDVLRTIGHMLGLYGHGKIHSGIHEGADGRLYFSTYWGKHREIDAAFEKGYRGSLLMRYDPKTGTAESLGPIVPKQGLPASAFDADRQLLYFHAVYEGNVAVYDLKAQKVKFLGGAEKTEGNRTFMVGRDGRVFFTGEGGVLNFYDPQTNKIGRTGVTLPDGGGKKKGNTLRAAARATKGGLLYGMTAAGEMFSFDPDSETVKDLGPNFLDGDYTAVTVLSPDEKYLYYAPGAHGSGNRTGAPVVQYNVATGQRKVIAFLRDVLRERLNYNVGGTYNLQIDPAGERLFFTFNGERVGGPRPETFGTPCVAVVHVPASER